jgi:hypothetical protein
MERIGAKAFLYNTRRAKIGPCFFEIFFIRDFPSYRRKPVIPGKKRVPRDIIVLKLDTLSQHVSKRKRKECPNEKNFEIGKPLAQKFVFKSELSFDELNQRENTTMNIRAIVIAGALSASMGLSAHAQQQMTLVKSVIGCGFTSATVTVGGATFTVDGTIGQPIIGEVDGGSPLLSDYQGFWTPNFSTGGVQEQPVGLADGFDLEQNYPNPFNPSTTIKYSVPERTRVTIRVMNLLGEEVHLPLVDDVKDPGSYQIDFTDADNLPSGTYIYRMDAGSFTASKRMVLLK